MEDTSLVEVGRIYDANGLFQGFYYKCLVCGFRDRDGSAVSKHIEEEHSITAQAASEEILDALERMESDGPKRD